MNDGGLTREQFNIGIDKFVEKSKAFNENWCVCHVEGSPAEKYLVKRQMTAAIVGNKEKSENLTDGTKEYLEDDILMFDNAVYSGHAELLKEILTFEYHVVYSSSYNVPVLYFNAWSQDGKLLSLSDIWQQVSEIHQDFLNHDKWSFITQQEHPLLHRPYFLIHPCHTAELMKQILMNTSVHKRDATLYLTTWLSAVGSAVGIRLPLQFGMSENQNKIMT
ncbi:ubiquitin-like-conjugating enzyme ATG10 [Dendronephthya gigantea]|uniref:ubiquitin-like-conjugating enzyme ATG10 n=1 Tax=Dendronephthya gigantea TaxID=151771 RepID=UPI001069B726|nr:ubiquitin-like-conjugating enzyme ATG10 [Dendronephthya gigantea]XP_028413494.1 ubiquitin-like-conjugating enzyme ATG10 [Dendronephthya gigantea]